MKSLNKTYDLENEEELMLQLDEREEFFSLCLVNHTGCYNLVWCGVNSYWF